MQFEPECTDSGSTEQENCEEFGQAIDRAPDRRHHVLNMASSDRENLIRSVESGPSKRPATYDRANDRRGHSTVQATGDIDRASSRWTWATNVANHPARVADVAI